MFPCSLFLKKASFQQMCWKQKLKVVHFLASSTIKQALESSTVQHYEILCSNYYFIGKNSVVSYCRLWQVFDCFLKSGCFENSTYMLRYTYIYWNWIYPIVKNACARHPGPWCAAVLSYLENGHLKLNLYQLRLSGTLCHACNSCEDTGC